MWLNEYIFLWTYQMTPKYFIPNENYRLCRFCTWKCTEEVWQDGKTKQKRRLFLYLVSSDVKSFQIHLKYLLITFLCTMCSANVFYLLCFSAFTIYVLYIHVQYYTPAQIWVKCRWPTREIIKYILNQIHWSESGQNICFHM